jgi:putative endonuclease
MKLPRLTDRSDSGERSADDIRIPPHRGAGTESSSYVYLLANERYGTLYIGVTSDLVKRVWQHRESVADGFTKKYRIKRLVWFEVHGDIMAAITREKVLKKWSRASKIELIQRENPYWRDLYEDFTA